MKQLDQISKQKLLKIVSEYCGADYAPFEETIFKARILKYNGFIIDKVLNDNYYDIEMDLYHLMLSVLKYLYHKNPSYIHNTIQMIGFQENYNLLNLLVRLPQLLDSPTLLNQTFYIIDAIVDINLFLKLFDGIEALKTLRLHFTPDEYKRIWNGKPDTTYLYQIYEEFGPTIKSRTPNDWFYKLMKYYPGKVELAPINCCQGGNDA